MKCQNPGCNNSIPAVKSGYQKITCCRECQYELRTLNSQNTCMEKYGVKSIAGTPAVATKRRKTLLERYGSENFTNRAQAKATLNELYGIDNISQLQSVKDKKVSTCLENYGVTNPNKSDVIRDRSKKTKLKRYSAETYNNRNKAKETMLEKFGFEHSMQSPAEVEN